MILRPWISIALSAALLTGCAVVPQPPQSSASVAQAQPILAPTGTLRVGVYPGSPTSLIEKPQGGLSGVSYEMGTLLAAQLNVPVRVVKFERIAQVIDAIKAGEVDFTVTNASAARAQVVAFTAPVIALELGYLAARDGKIQSIDAVDVAGASIGVSRGSSSLAALSGQLKQARLVQFDALSAAADALQQGQIDAFATNKGILFELAEKVPSASVLPGRWGLEHMAVAIPKGREAALPSLEAFAKNLQQDGGLARIIASSGLRGTVAVK